METIDNWLRHNGSFNYFGFILEINCTEEEYGANDPSVLSVRTHEYVHYLQAVTTTYGIRTTLGLLEKLNECFREIHRNPNASTPIQNIEDDTFQNALARYENHRNNTRIGSDLVPIQNQLTEYRLYTKTYADLTNATEHNTHHFPCSNNEHWVPLSPITFRETMATIAMLINMNMNHAEIYYFLRNSNLQKKYTELYIYFYTRFNEKIDDVAKFVFKFCEICLMCTHPNNGVYQIFDKVICNLNKMPNVETSSFFQELMKSDYYDALLRLELARLDTLLDNKLECFQRLANYNHFGQCAFDLISILKTSVKRRRNDYSIYSDYFGVDWFNQSVNDFGCPLIKLNTGSLFTHTSHNSHISDTVDFIYSVYVTFEDSIYRTISECPFYERLCEASVRARDPCLFAPHEVQADQDGAYCIFINSLRIIGIHSQG